MGCSLVQVTHMKLGYSYIHIQYYERDMSCSLVWVTQFYGRHCNYLVNPNGQVALVAQNNPECSLGRPLFFLIYSTVGQTIFVYLLRTDLKQQRRNHSFRRKSDSLLRSKVVKQRKWWWFTFYSTFQPNRLLRAGSCASVLEA